MSDESDCIDQTQLLDFLRDFSTPMPMPVRKEQAPTAPVPATVGAPATPTSAGSAWGQATWQPPTGNPMPTAAARRSASGRSSSLWDEPDLRSLPPLDAPRNGLATLSLLSGLGSILVPFLALLGLWAGAVALQRIERHPWLPGRRQSGLGVALSLVFGPLSTIVWAMVLSAGLVHL